MAKPTAETGTPIEVKETDQAATRLDRRRWARKELLLRLRVSDELDVELGEVGDLSLGGMALVADLGSQPAVGDELGLIIGLPSSMAAHGPLRVEATCRWVGGVDVGRVRCGIEFRDLDERTRQLLAILTSRFVGELSWESRREAHQLVISLRGALDDKAGLGDLARQIAEPVCLDLGALMRINSHGASVWLEFLGDLDGIERITLRRCSPPFVAQMNMIANFQGRATVESVLLPFICDGCDAEQAIEQPVAQIEPLDPQLPRVHCARCGEEMAFDDMAERYFAFLRRGREDAP